MTIDHRQPPLPAAGPLAGGGPAFSAGERWAVLAMLGGGFVVVLDFFVVMVALPSIQRGLGASHATLAGVVAVYAASMASALVLGGRLGDRLGRRRMFLVGLAGFGLASAGSAMASTPAELVAMRALQGLAAALVQPQVLALLSDGFTGPKRARVFAAYAMSMGVAGMLAQILGGWVIELDLWGLGWRNAFLLNVPFVLAALALAAAALRETARRPGLAMDLPGSALFGAMLGLLVMALTYGLEAGSAAWTAAWLAASAACALAFTRHQRRLDRSGRDPMLPPRLLAAPGFVRGALSVLLFYGTVASLYFVLGLHLQSTLGLEPMESGLMFAVLGAAFVLSSMLGGRASGDGRCACLVGGALLSVVGHLWQALAHAAFPGILGLLPGLMAQGTGIGLVMAALVSAVLATAPSDLAGLAAGVLSTLQQVGNALGVAAITAALALGSPGPAGAAAADGFAVAMLCLSAASSLLAWVFWRGRGTPRPA